jgi:hypothetical protein
VPLGSLWDQLRKWFPNTDGQSGLAVPVSVKGGASLVGRDP